MGKVLGLLVAALALSGCLATPYQSRGWWRGGVETQPIGSGRYFVASTTNNWSSPSAAMAYLNRAAGDSCRSAGYDSYWLEDVVYAGVNDRIRYGFAATAVCSRTSAAR